MLDSDSSDQSLAEEFSNVDAKVLHLQSVAVPSDFYVKLDEALISLLCTELKISQTHLRAAVTVGKPSYLYAAYHLIL